MQDTITPIIIPRYATLHLVAYSCMNYADDAQHNNQHDLAEQVRKMLKRYVDTVKQFHPEMNFDMVDDLQVEINDQILLQSCHLFEPRNKYYVMMCIYLNATYAAVDDLIRTRVPFIQSELVILHELRKRSENLLKKLNWAFKREGLDAWAAILKHNQEEFTL